MIAGTSSVAPQTSRVSGVYGLAPGGRQRGAMAVTDGPGGTDPVYGLDRGGVPGFGWPWPSIARNRCFGMSAIAQVVFFGAELFEVALDVVRRPR